MAQYRKTADEITVGEVRENIQQGLIAKALETGDVAGAAYWQRIMLIILDTKRRFDSGATKEGRVKIQIQPWHDLLTDMVILADERQPAPRRIKAAKNILKKHIKRPLFPKRLKSIK